MNAIAVAVAIAGTVIGIALVLIWAILALLGRLDDHDERHYGVRSS